MKKTKNNKKGFTLLELLVVVLIIGILAAIALPQYRKAKVKAEAKQLVLSVKALAEAQQRFYLLNNRYATQFSDLDIDFSGYPNHSCSKYLWHFAIADCISNDKSILMISSGGGRPAFALFNYGKYFGSGFRSDNNRTVCYFWPSDGTNSNVCTEVLNCKWLSSWGNASNKYYECPNV